MALTAKKKAFGDAVLAGKSNKAAAVVAGYSAKTASPAGSRLAKDPDVVAYLGKKKAPKARKTGHTQADGTKAPDAPPGWPFGVKVEEPVTQKKMTAREYLSDVVNDVAADEKLRLDAAKKLIEFEEAKPAAVGKKEARQKDAEKTAGRFSAGAPPKLAAVGGKRV